MLEKMLVIRYVPMCVEAETVLATCRIEESGV